MQALHSIVLLYKDLATRQFNLLCEEWTSIERGLGYVHLENVTFDIYEDKKDSTKRTVHAVARGTLVNALPPGLNPAKDIIKKFGKLPEIDYKPSASTFFFFSSSLEEIHSAKTLYAYNGEVRVEV